MANVLFTRKAAPTLAESQNVAPVTDGQLIFDTSGSGKMYMDVGSTRMEMGGAMTIDSKLNSTSINPIQNKAVGGVMLSTLDEINTATSKGFITDALATRALAQKIGTTDISSIGDGTCTGAISALNSNNVQDIKSKINSDVVKSVENAKIITCGRVCHVELACTLKEVPNASAAKLLNGLFPTPLGSWHQDFAFLSPKNTVPIYVTANSIGLWFNIGTIADGTGLMFFITYSF